MKLVYLAVFYPFENGLGYTVEFPDLPGCITQGDSLEEALDMAADAASGWILGEIEEGYNIPSPSKSIRLDDFDGATFSNYVVIDMEEYAKLYGNKAVKKTLTIPRWLNTLSEKQGINFSQVLQEALKEKLDLTLNDASTTKPLDEDSFNVFANEIIGRVDALYDCFETSIDKSTKSTDFTLNKRIKLYDNKINAN